MSVTEKIKESVKELKDDIKELAHRRGHRHKLPVRHTGDNAFFSLQREINSLFDDLYREHGLLESRFGEMSGLLKAEWPSVDVTESAKQVKVKAELPGMEEEDIDVSVTEEALTIRGEKKTETEEKGEDYYHQECSYGSFQRTIPLPCEIESDKVDASFKKGVLTVTLPKSEAAQAKVKKVKVKPQ